MLSNACAYGLQAMIYLARQPRNRFVAIDSIAAAVGLPRAFLRKVMNKLVHARLVHSVRGASGGVCLTRDPNSVSIFDIIVAIDGDKRFTRCMLHFDQCNPTNPCPFHEEWTKQQEAFQERLQTLTLRDIAYSMPKYYLTHGKSP